MIRFFTRVQRIDRQLCRVAMEMSEKLVARILETSKEDAPAGAL